MNKKYLAIGLIAVAAYIAYSYYIKSRKEKTTPDSNNMTTDAVEWTPTAEEITASRLKKSEKL